MSKVLSKPSPLTTGDYLLSTKHFFTPSKLLYAQITDLFDEVWPTVTAMKNLRWQVKGYHEQYDVPQNDQLTRKFVEPNDKTNRSNLYRAFIIESWEDTEYRICRNLLINIFALYEAWADDMAKILGVPQKGDMLQFPTSNINRNYLTLLTQLQASPNPIVRDSWYSKYKSTNSQYNYALLDNWLTEYRYFKECRNCIVHSAGIANQRVLDAYNRISGFTTADLDVSEVPETYTPIVGKRIKLTLRGVVGFSQIILKLVSTFDVEFIKCQGADKYLIDSLKVLFPNTFGTDTFRKEKQTNYITSKAHLQKPLFPDQVYLLLKQNGIMR